MSIQVGEFDTSTMQVGNSITVSWQGQVRPVMTSPALATASEQRPMAHLRIWNESGVGWGLQSNGGRQDIVAAGAWPVYELDPSEVSCVLTAKYVLPNQPVSQLYAILYQPDEPVPPTPVLGNSPIGIAGTVTTGSNVGSASAINYDPTAINGETPGSVQSTAASGGASPLVDVSDTNSTGGKRRFIQKTGEADINEDGSITAPAFHGTADHVPASGVQAGALPSGVTIGGSQVGGAVASANALGPFGAFSGVGNDTLYTHQPAGTATGFDVQTWDGAAAHAANLVDGSGVRYADQATNANNATTANSADSVPASGVQNGNLPSGVADLNGHPLRGMSHFSGTGSGTYNHNYSPTTPNYIGITSTEPNSTQTVGVDSIGSSTVHVNMPQAWPFTGLATAT